MSRHFLIEQLQNISNARKENRQKVAVIVLNDKNLHQELLKITFDVTNELSIKAAWILEWICTHHSLLIVIENLEQFTTNLKRLRFDSAIRPCAKICEQLAIAFFDKKQALEPTVVDTRAEFQKQLKYPEHDFSDVKGQE
mgnify:CR=1 FL=1